MLSRISVRGASSAAASATASAPTKQTHTTPSGLIVSSDERNGAVSHLVLAFRAGTRYELPSQKGLVHHIRNFVGRDTNNYLGVPLLWSTAGTGATIRAFATRDLYGVTLSVPRAEVNVALSVLGHVAAQPSFKPWELVENQETLIADLASRSAFDFLNDDVHRAAFRNGGLSNGLFAPKKLVGTYSQAELQGFAASRLVSGEAALFGINVAHDVLANYGENHAPLNSGKGQPTKASPFVGGESRRWSSGKLAHVLLVGEGATISDVKGLAAQNVLLATLAHNTLKYGGKSGNGILAKAVANEGAGISAYQAAYADSGIAGVYLTVDGAAAGSAVRSIAKALKNFTAGDIEGAKALATSRVAFGVENGADFVIDKAAYLLGAKGECIMIAISQTTKADIEAAAKKLSKKFALASYGDIDHVPYVDEL
ncbi:unnamed protein product, partial [Mesorhabditis belari]|uniref:Peptidase M16 N-terminal domain-containing protein n=1 Tax=Mesorhabditis belari TaxID=2138241 RepID=A0AAF3FFS7_9BILA